jgi:hypothetical protein
MTYSSFAIAELVERLLDGNEEDMDIVSSWGVYNTMCLTHTMWGSYFILRGSEDENTEHRQWSFLGSAGFCLPLMSAFSFF